MESVGCKFVFLPPYSPDLNPILLANMKRWISGKIFSFDKLYTALNQFFTLQTST
ncbi:hypothetical protein [Candidatus Sarmatiella mevalonica]|uniref:hypothetical protein n=1 Tax=Candidatus Sarmatiella mevalonica TaxID=2770581 RepID=UPI003132CF7C